MESALVTWIPSIAASGMAVNLGDRFAAWKGNVFVGAMRVGEILGTGHVQRVVFNSKMEEIRRESMSTELRQRIREVREGPDGRGQGYAARGSESGTAAASSGLCGMPHSGWNRSRW
jgi:aldose sugar dehydrogenase